MKQEIEALAEKWVDENYAHQLDIDPYKCFIAGYNAANEWVKCSDRLPEDNSVTLVTYHGVVCTARLFEVTHQWYSSYANGFVNPTHWMPLPPPPTT